MSKRCSTMEVHRRLLEEDPQMADRLAQIEARVEPLVKARLRQQAQADEIAQTGGPLELPQIPLIQVVVHVVYNTDEQNISDEQVLSQIRVLNEDYCGTNSDRDQTPDRFTQYLGIPDISFALASSGPKGQATTGITRFQTSKLSFTDNDDVKFTARGGVDAWDRNRYLNIWVCNLIVLEDGVDQRVLGYTQFPGGPASTDGTVILYTAFGNTGAVDSDTNLGRTATHEIGHWLGLHHLWGDEKTNPSCALELGVHDTPVQFRANEGSPKGIVPSVHCPNLPNGDMYMNFMDYVDDSAMFMFTREQSARMFIILTEVRNLRAPRTLIDAPRILGLPNDKRFGVFANQLWLTFTEDTRERKVWLLHSTDGQNWEVVLPDVLGFASSTAPAMAMLNNEMWISITSNFPTRDLMVFRASDPTSFMGQAPDTDGAWSSGSAQTLASFRGELWVAFAGIGSPGQVQVGLFSEGDLGPLASACIGTPSLTSFDDAQGGPRLWIAFSEGIPTPPWTARKLAVCSSGDGFTWSAPARVLSTPLDVVDTNLGPSLVVWQGRLWLAFVSPERDVLVCSSTDGAAWSLPVTVGDASTMAGLCLSVFQNDKNPEKLWLAYVADEGPRAGHIIIVCSSDGQHWDTVSHISPAILAVRT